MKMSFFVVVYLAVDLLIFVLAPECQDIVLDNTGSDIRNCLTHAIGFKAADIGSLS